MQATLLGFGLALIAAIVAAFAAPFFIDWNAWRPQFEERASTLAGTQVTIAGKIDATLLPAPAFVLRDVSLGDPDNGTGMQAAEVRGALSLSALLSGNFEATEIVVSRPALRGAIGEDGALILPRAVVAMNANALTITAFVLESGSLILEDKRTGSFLVADDLSARGELLSRQGPFKIEAGMRINNRRWTANLSTARFGADHSSRVRLALSRPADGFALEADGVLALAESAPRFDGKLQITRRGDAMPWRLSAAAAGNSSEIVLSQLEVALGEGDTPIMLTGNARLAPRFGGTIEAELAAKRIDFDRGDPKAAERGAAQIAPLLAEAAALFRGLPFNGTISLAADGVMAGGQLSRDVRAGVFVRGGSVGLDRLEARLPHRGTLKLSGKTEGHAFAGALSLESEEPKALARWLLGQELAEKFGDPEALRIRGDIFFSPEKLALEKLDAQIGAIHLTGAAAILSRAGARPLVSANLAAARIDFDPLLPMLDEFFVGDHGYDVAADISARDARFAGKTARSVTLRFVNADGASSLERLAVENYDGLSFTAARADKERAGILKLDGELTGAGGLGAIAERFFAAKEMPRWAAVLFERTGGFKFSGRYAREEADHLLAIGNADASIEFRLGDSRNGARKLAATLKRKDTELFANGEIRVAADGKVAPMLDLELKASDLRGAFAMVERAATLPVSAAANAKLVRDGERFVFDGLSFDISGVRGGGRLIAGTDGAITGRLAVQRMSVTELARLALGRATGDGRWSKNAMHDPALAGFSGQVDVEVGALDLIERVAATKVKFTAKLAAGEVAVEEFAGEIAGGKFHGKTVLSHGRARAADVLLRVVDVDLSRALSLKTLRGRLDGEIAFSAAGSSPAELIAGLAGHGKISIHNFELDAAHPGALADVLKDRASLGAGEAEIEKIAAAALARRPLQLSKFDARLLLTGGTLRISPEPAKADQVAVKGEGTVNLQEISLDASLTLESTEKADTGAGVTLRFRGPLDAPVRSIDSRALFAAISLRAIERGASDEKPAPQPRPRPQDAAPDLPPPTVVPDTRIVPPRSERQKPVPPPTNLIPPPPAFDPFNPRTWR